LMNSYWTTCQCWGLEEGPAQGPVLAVECCVEGGQNVGYVELPYFSGRRPDVETCGGETKISITYRCKDYTFATPEAYMKFWKENSLESRNGKCY